MAVPVRRVCPQQQPRGTGEAPPRTPSAKPVKQTLESPTRACAPACENATCHPRGAIAAFRRTVTAQNSALDNRTAPGHRSACTTPWLGLRWGSRTLAGASAPRRTAGARWRQRCGAAPGRSAPWPGGSGPPCARSRQGPQTRARRRSPAPAPRSPRSTAAQRGAWERWADVSTASLHTAAMRAPPLQLASGRQDGHMLVPWLSCSERHTALQHVKPKEQTFYLPVP